MLRPAIPKISGIKRTKGGEPLWPTDAPASDPKDKRGKFSPVQIWRDERQACREEWVQAESGILVCQSCRRCAADRSMMKRPKVGQGRHCRGVLPARQRLRERNYRVRKGAGRQAGALHRLTLRVGPRIASTVQCAHSFAAIMHHEPHWSVIQVKVLELVLAHAIIESGKILSTTTTGLTADAHRVCETYQDTRIVKPVGPRACS